MYPKLVEIDMQKETRDFYDKLYNLQLIDEQVQNMLVRWKTRHNLLIDNSTPVSLVYARFPLANIS